VSIVSDYLNDTQSLEILCQSDLIVFPYQETGESASGAVRFGIATGRVVAVTPLTIFNDVRNLVHRLPGTTPVDIAKGIAQLADSSNNFTMPLEQQVQTNEWLEELRYSRLGKRLHSMLRALHFDRHRPV
jgi:O-antigen biosynthesis alpha-1,2-mannosyltransferase